MLTWHEAKLSVQQLSNAQSRTPQLQGGLRKCAMMGGAMPGAAITGDRPWDKSPAADFKTQWCPGHKGICSPTFSQNFGLLDVKVSVTALG